MDAPPDDIVNTISSDGGDSVTEIVQNPAKKRKRKSNKKSTVSTSENGLGRRSQYFDHFEKSDVAHKLKCKYCPTLITHRSFNGTTALKNHTERCMNFPANIDRKQKLISFDSKTIVAEDGTVQHVSIPKLWKHDQSFSRKKCAKMIICDELPFSFVERIGFREFCQALCPEFVPPSRTTVTRDCYGLYIDERGALKEFFSKLSSRVSLTTDTWTSGQNLGYMCLTAHFIDDNWNLHKRVINFCPVAGHSGEVIGRSIEQCLVQWNLKRVLTCTVDNASANNVAIDYLKRRVNFWKGSVLDAKYIHMRCAAHILNLIVKEGLKDHDLSIIRIRAAVRFVRSSPGRTKSFKASIKEVNIESKSLVPLDVETRWNSTYLMLQSAWKFKEAFDNLNSKGGVYTSYLSRKFGVPEESDWEAVSTFLLFLEIFYDAALKFSGCLHVTSNSFIPEIVGVGNLISSYCEHANEKIRNMGFKMKEKYDKYWADVDNINILLFISLILDPRYKWEFVEWTIKDTFDIESANMLVMTVKKCLKTLYESYDISTPSEKNDEPVPTCSTPTVSVDHHLRDDKKVDAHQLLMSRYRLEKGTSSVVDNKSELDKYLSDRIESNDPNFDILAWWKDCSKIRYPILAKMAKDVLAMPVSSVASESAFSTGGRVLDTFRTSLTPRMVEALICTQDWLRKSHGPLIIEESLLELQALEESMQELTLKQPEIFVDESLVASDLEDDM